MSSRVLNPHKLRELLYDGRCYAHLGVVITPAGESEHYEKVTDDDGTILDVVVDVELQLRKEHLRCRLGSVCGGAGFGVWHIPPVGTEVAVVVPEGERDFRPIIVATLSSAEVPSDVSAANIVICAPANGKVKIHAGGTASPVATLADLQEVRSKYNDHTHGGTVAVPTLLASAPSGTAVLEAE